MPEWLQIVILGLIEGITEFLPVSSTGHLILAEHWLGGRSELFNVVVQTGAVLAVLAVFSRRAVDLVVRFNLPENRDYLLKLVVAFGITGVCGLAMKKAGLRLEKSPTPVAIATLVGGILFVVAELWLRGRKQSERVTWVIALAVAAGQLLAIAYPGTSRSGATILFALALGLARPAAAEFSFLLGIPTLLAAAGKESLDAYKDHTPHEPWSLILLGTGVAAIAAFVVVKWFLGYLRTHSFMVFGWYRIVLGIGILLLLKS
ncbi:MAG: undecaprenyl-diphosphate phosphatase [Verrucomicrobia bacterium]|nr:MAG: undecaprenyl-diphosphate phosphatase [Verrucomicrobiota bacterium]